jgi:hypothetical protein
MRPTVVDKQSPQIVCSLIGIYLDPNFCGFECRIAQRAQKTCSKVFPARKLRRQIFGQDPKNKIMIWDDSRKNGFLHRHWCHQSGIWQRLSTTKAPAEIDWDWPMLFLLLHHHSAAHHCLLSTHRPVLKASDQSNMWSKKEHLITRQLLVGISSF